MAFSKDGNCLAVSLFYLTQFCGLRSPSSPEIAEVDLGNVTAIAYSADAQLLAIQTSQHEKGWDPSPYAYVEVLNVHSLVVGKPKVISRLHVNPLVMGLAFSPDGNILAAVDLYNVHVWAWHQPIYPWFGDSSNDN
jgi:hypothetical protein